ncbi:MraY family glycosyltransferase [Spirosoma areae]
MSLIAYCFLTVALVSAEVLFLRMARYFAWFDKPNERSLHTNSTTIRGGGIVFYLAALGAFVFTRFNQPLFFIGLTLIALVSFWDDLYSVPKRYRLSIQSIAVSLVVSQMEGFSGQGWLFIGVLIMGVGLLNAYNFMDGINGITAFYSLVTIGTIGYWQVRVLRIEPDPLLIVTILALLIFSYFNARQQAICFAGDVGSVSIGFIVLYEVWGVVERAHTYLPLLFVAVYGVDTALTIGQRLYHRQAIFQAHRLHLFQVLVAERHWPHLRVSATYALVQAGINGLILNAMQQPPMTQWTVAGMVLSGLVTVYVALKTGIYNKKGSVF